MDTNVGCARGHLFADSMCHRWLSSEWFHSIGRVRHATKACALSHGWSGCRRGCCWVFGCASSALRGPFAGGYIVCSCMLAFTVVFGFSFPCLLLLRLALRCSECLENHPKAHLRALQVQGPQVQVSSARLGFGASLARATEGTEGGVLGVHYIFFRPSRMICLGVLVVLHGVAGRQSLVASVTRRFEQLSLMKFLMCLLMCCSCFFFAACWIPQFLIEVCEVK